MTEANVLDLLSEVAGRAGGPSPERSTRLADLGIDSFGLLEVLTMLEGRAQRAVPDDPPELRDVGDVLDYHAWLMGSLSKDAAPLTVDQLERTAQLAADLDDPEAMPDAWS